MKPVSLVLITIVAMLNVLLTSAYGQQARSGSQSEVVAAAFSAEVTGTVKSVDQKSGKLILDTVDGPVNVTFPADAVQAIKVGDEVTVAVALLKPPPSASPQTAPAKK
jgi:ferric-dicitrate binding protein FerR (iron transport regulator)